MTADARITYRTRNPYNTRSNYFVKVRTPGNRLVIHYLKKLHLKQRSLPRCMDTKKPLRGLFPNRGNYKNRRLTTVQKKRKPVSRKYGGCLSHQALRERIVRAFLVEESRIRKRMKKALQERRANKTTSGKKKKVKNKKIKRKK